MEILGTTEGYLIKAANANKARPALVDYYILPKYHQIGKKVETEIVYLSLCLAGTSNSTAKGVLTINLPSLTATKENNAHV